MPQDSWLPLLTLQTESLTRSLLLLLSELVPSAKEISSSISMEQYQHLLTLLGDHKITETPASTALFACKLCLLSSLNSGWIVDSEASDHML